MVAAALVALIGLVGLMAGCSSSGGSSSPASAGSGAPVSGTVISLKDLMFAPATTRIKVGTTVTWKNDEPITHTVTSGRITGVDKTTGLRSGQKPNGLFDKRLAGQGATFSYTFHRPGRYSYYCDIHFGMNATIIVTR